MWHNISLLPDIETTNEYNGLRSKIVLTKDNKGWIDLARFYYKSPDTLLDIVTINGYTITKKVLKWTDIPNE